MYIFHTTEWKQLPKTFILSISRPRILLSVGLSLYSKAVCRIFQLEYPCFTPALQQWHMFKLLHYARVDMTCQELMFLICKENNVFLLPVNQYILHVSALQHNCWEILCTTYTSLTSANISPVCSFYTPLVQTFPRIALPYSFHNPDISIPWAWQLQTILFLRIPPQGQLCLLRYLRCLFYLSQV